jgi:hypothetical protein
MMSSDEIFNSIVNLDVSASAKEAGSQLVETWLAECSEADTQDETIAVEAGFFVELAPNTFVVGAQDRIARNANLPLFGCEWKSTGAYSPARGSFPGWNAERWFEEISRGHQTATYALGLMRGTFVDEKVNRIIVDARKGLEEISILVRAISKSKPPQIWPDARGQFVTVTKERMKAVTNAYLITAAQIRSSRQLALVPWQLPGYICKGKYNGKFPCRFLSNCESQRYPVGDNKPHLSPGSQSVVDFMVERNVLDVRNDPVVISASSYGDWQDCSEKWRQASVVNDEISNDNLDVGKVLHAALATHYGEQINER